VALALLVSFAILWSFLFFYLRSTPEEGEEVSATQQEASLALLSSSVIEGEIQRNIPLFQELVRQGLSPSNVAELTSSLRIVFDPRQAKPGEKYRLHLLGEDSVSHFEYLPSGLYKYVVWSTPQGYMPALEAKRCGYSLKALSGEVRSSLWEAISAEGEGAQLVLKFANIFAWEIDFLTDPRPGDRFTIIYEVYGLEDEEPVYGEVIAAHYNLAGEDYYAFLYQDPEGRRDYFDLEGHSLRRTLLRSPLNYARISSGYSFARFHPIYKIWRPHLGVDYAAPIGTPVVSAGDGQVTYAGWKRGFGRYVEIRHPGGIVTSYGHLSRYGKGIRRGTKVRQNQVIGYVGSTGDSTGPHLDYRIRIHGRYVNPLKLKLPPAKPLKEVYLEDFKFHSRDLLFALKILETPSLDRSYLFTTLRGSADLLLSP
jgi:murein DD-endopeptidase MepM/ murein hydrolase activator NlpD